VSEENAEDWQDRDSKDRLEKCRGCDDLCEVLQERRFKGDCVTPYDPIKKVLHWWCRHFGLHLESVDRILGRGHSDYGKMKHCPYFRN
jgi:hypothetical protein